MIDNYFLSGEIRWFSIDLKNKFMEGETVTVNTTDNGLLKDVKIEHIYKKGLISFDDGKELVSVHYSEIISIHK